MECCYRDGMWLCNASFGNILRIIRLTHRRIIGMIVSLVRQQSSTQH